MRHMMVYTGKGRYEKVLIRNILYCEAQGNYTCLHINADKIILISKLLKEAEEELPGHLFYRVNRCFLVNLTHLRGYKSNRDLFVYMKDDKEIRVSRQKKKEFLDILKRKHPHL